MCSGHSIAPPNLLPPPACHARLDAHAPHKHRNRKTNRKQRKRREPPNAHRLGHHRRRRERPLLGLHDNPPVHHEKQLTQDVPPQLLRRVVDERRVEKVVGRAVVRFEVQIPLIV